MVRSGHVLGSSRRWVWTEKKNEDWTQGREWLVLGLSNRYALWRLFGIPRPELCRNKPEESRAR